MKQSPIKKLKQYHNISISVIDTAKHEFIDYKTDCAFCVLNNGGCTLKLPGSARCGHYGRKA